MLAYEPSYKLCWTPYVEYSQCGICGCWFDAQFYHLHGCPKCCDNMGVEA